METSCKRKQKGVFWPCVDDDIRREGGASHMDLRASNVEQTQPNFSLGAPPLTDHVAVVHKRTSFTLSVSLPRPLQAQRCVVQPCKNTHADTHTHTHNGVFPNTIKTHWCESNGMSLAVSFPESKAFRSLFVLHTLLFRLLPPPTTRPLPLHFCPSSSSTH